MASTGSWDIAVYQECCRWPPVLCRSQAQGLQLWEHQPGPELGDLWKELPDNIFSSVDLFAEVMITSPLFLRTFRAVIGQISTKHRGQKPTSPLSSKCLLPPPPKTLPSKSMLQEQWSLGKFTMRRQHSFFEGHQQIPSREAGCLCMHYIAFDSL